MQDDVAWLELRDMAWVSFNGEKAVDVLNGLLTNDVSTLADGQSLYAAALTPKGKIVADMYVTRESGTSFLTAVGALAFDGWWQIVRKYVNPRLAKYRDERESLVTIALCGPAARRVMSSIESIPTTRVLQLPALGTISCSYLVVSVEHAAAVRELLAHEIGSEASYSAYDVARIEAGRPVWGFDMDDTTLAQEANLEEFEAISFEKGCYTGQETVARVHFRGHVNRHLRGLASAILPAPGSDVHSMDGKLLGIVKSCAVSPRFGPIAIAMIRREVADAATVLVRATDGTPIEASVRSLPFTAAFTPAQ